MHCSKPMMPVVRRLAAAIAIAQGLSGCATAPAASSAGGAAVAGATGWVSGEDARQKVRRAAAAAGVAVLPASASGYYMDVDEAKFREQLGGAGVAISRVGGDVTLLLPADAAFAGDGADVSASFVGVLDSLAGVLKKYDKTVIEVAGHADGSAATDRGEALSERRAAAIAAELVRRGVARARITTIGAGASHAVASNATAQGRARNRRVEVTVSPLEKPAG